MPISVPAVMRLRPRNADQPAHRRHDEAEHALERDRRAADVAAAAPSIALTRCTSATNTISMAIMLSSSVEARGRALGDGVHGAFGDRLSTSSELVGVSFVVRHHDLADHHRDRRAEHRGDDEMAGGVGNERRAEIAA